MIFFYKESKFKKIFFFFFWGGGWGGEGRGEMMEGHTNRPKPICPLKIFEVGGITMHKCTSYGPDKFNL